MKAITKAFMKSLNISINSIMIIAVLLMGIVMISSVFILYQNRISNEYTRNASSLVRLLASYIDGDSIDHYLHTGEKDYKYMQVINFMRTIKNETEAMFVYVTKPVEGGEIFIFDADVDPNTFIDLGGFEQWTEEDYDMELLPHLIRGERVAPYRYNTEWGILLTAHEPIFRSDGSVAAYANVDISLDRIYRERTTFFINIIAIFVIILFLAILTNSIIIKKLVIDPVYFLVSKVSAYRTDLSSNITSRNISSAVLIDNEFKVLENAIIKMEDRIEDSVTSLQEALENANAANLSKSRFLTTMSHEIRTPMNTVIGITQTELQKDTLPDEYRKAFEIIYTSGNNLLGLINDILDLSKVETGMIELHPVEYDLADVINDVLQLNAVRIGTKELEMVVDVDENTPSKLYGDDLRIKQILNNLLSNAIKYTEEGYVKLTVDHLKVSDDIFVRFVIEDSGQGFKPEDIDLAFSDYSRFNLEKNRNMEGTGIGLRITKDLIDIMDGSIKVESEYGKGSIFTVTVKQEAVECDIIGTEVSERLRDNKYSEYSSRNEKVTYEQMPYGKVLVVDDVELNLLVAKGFLDLYELNVDMVISGIIAIEKIKAGETFDIIFMDHMMPEMDGIEATKIIREMGYNNTIVALTANAIVGNKEMFMENGFDDFISKPIEFHELNRLLNKYVRDKFEDELQTVRK